MATVLRELNDYRGSACLVEHNGAFYVVSSANAMFTGPETLVFPADAAGRVTDWGEVAGGRGMSRDDAIYDLEQQTPERLAGEDW